MPRPMKKQKPPETPKPLRLEYLDPAELEANPMNWRTHPPKQVATLQALMAEVGWAGALLFNERTGRLVDGHARKGLFEGKGKVPVLIGSWDEETEKKIILMLDPISKMATTDTDILTQLIQDVQTESDDLNDLLQSLAKDAGISFEEEGGESGDDSGGAGGEEQTEFHYKILVECDSEEQQAELIDRLTEEGIECRAIVV